MADSTNVLNFISDTYNEEDLLGFDKYINTLNKMIQNPEFKTPFCIGIYGKWGSGKTTFMRLLFNEFKQYDSKPYIIPVWFNPWRYGKEDHLIIPFLKTIEQTIKKNLEDIEQNKKLKDKLGTEVISGLKNAMHKTFDAVAALIYSLDSEVKISAPIAECTFALDSSKAIERYEKLKKDWENKNKSLAENMSSIYYDIFEELKKVTNEKIFRITVFIDDLDRCLPEKAMELFEAFKLFLDFPGYLFVIGVAKEVVEKGIDHRYSYLNKERTNEPCVSPEAYLDKMIQFPMDLPPIEPTRKKEYIKKLLGNKTKYTEHIDIIEIAIGENPRSLKRFINLLAFMSQHAETIKEGILKNCEESSNEGKLIKKYFAPIFYIKWSIIIFKLPQKRSMIKGNYQHLIDLQKVATDKWGGTPEEKDKIIPPSEAWLKEVLKKPELFLETPQKDFQWLIEKFVYLAETTIFRGKEVQNSNYQPGDEVLIPKGEFLYSETKEKKNIDYDYYMDVFPVTNQQYKKFIDDNNYHKNNGYPVPYSDENWAKLYNWDKDNRTFPKGMENHPVVLVSYKDTLEFCKWRTLTKDLKSDKAFRLPTEEEWEKAARGTDGRKYTWGDEFDEEKCNTSESGMGKTSEVTRYPSGISPYGCQDMGGNVWEWTDSWYNKKNELKVLRGGSWYDIRSDGRCAIRLRLIPEKRFNDVGFRCSRTL